MAMSGRANGNPGGEIEKAIAIDVLNDRAVASLDGERIDTRVRRRSVLLVGRNQVAGARTGQLGSNPGHLKGFSSLGHGSPSWCESTKQILRCRPKWAKIQ